MSKKMWNKIFKSKTNKNSKALQAANKINKRTSIYEEYQQLNAALDSGPINEKFKDKTKPASLDATTTFNDNDTDKTTLKPTTTFSKVVNTLTLKRSQNSNTSKDARNGNDTKKTNLKTSELNIETLSTTSLPANRTNNQNVANCNSNKNNITYSNSSSNINSSTITLSHCNINTTCSKTSLNQQQTLTEIKATTATDATTAASLNSKLNNINNNDYFACQQNLTNPPTIPTTPQLPPTTLLQPQKRLSKIVIVVKKFDAATTATATNTAATRSAPLFASDLATNLNKQNQIFCIDRTNNSSTNNHFNNNHDNGSLSTTTNTNNSLETSIEATSTFETPSAATSASATTITTTTPPSSTAINAENQLSINLSNRAKETTMNSDRYGTFLKKDDHDDHQQRQQQHKVDNGNNITTPTEVPETNASVELAPCPICSRTFNPVTLRKHVGICEKTATKKRNKFDSSRQRREGTELATYCLPKNFGLPEKTTSTTSITQGRNDRGHSPKPNAQQVSSPILTRKKPPEDLMRSTARASMRKAAASSNNNSTNSISTTSTPSNPSNFNRDRMRSSERSLARRGIQPPPAEQCPHCERCFGLKAYDRHVEWCKEKALLASIKHGSSKNEGNVAKARLEARTKYRAPCLKTKRFINREKYSGLANDELEPEDTSKCSKTSANKTQENNFMSMSMTSSVCSERNIMNSTTGNINEPVATKENKNKLTVRSLVKTFVTKLRTQQPPPTKTAKEKRIAARKAEKGEQRYSKSNSQQWKTADVQMNLLAAAKNLEQKKSGSDLSSDSMLHDKCWKQTHKTLKAVSRNQDDRNYHYDNESNFDEMAFEEANQKSKDYFEFSESLKSCGPAKTPEEYESDEIILQETHFSKLHKRKSHENKIPNIKSNNSVNSDAEEEEVVKCPALERDLSPKLYYSKINKDQAIENYDFEESKLSDEPKCSRRQSSKKVALPRSLKKQFTHDKIIAAKSKSSENGAGPLACKYNEANSQTNEFFTEIEIFKDCLTDSDELRRSKNSDSITDQVRKGSSKPDTFIRQLNENVYELQQIPENYNENFKNSKDLSLPDAVIKPAKKHVPNKKCLRSSSPLPQISPLLVTSSLPDTDPLLPLKMCPARRKKSLRQTASCTNSPSCPMKAFASSLSMEHLRIGGVSSEATIQSDSSRRDNRQQEIECNDKNYHTIEEDGVEKKTSKEIKVVKEPRQLKRNRSFTVIGLPDNYDPFLSAKRQLEELCSPSADSVELQNTALTPKLPSLPATPNSNNKMTTSLTLNSSAATNTASSLMTTSQIPQQTPKTPVLARSSSFRRTSSLRGPRRSPMLSTRPPLFAQKHRPTIQRGLSDEGPISTNFLKPEEYDEMPVRSVCVNDFAVNKSPRVVRRDTSASNRKQPLKLNVNAANNINSNSNTESPQDADMEIVNNNTVSKYVSKTDSLAVFLKFEHELENLNTSAAAEEELRTACSSFGTPSSNLDGPLNAKELKDKSNNLSKQNSNKNIKADSLALASTDNDNNNSQLYLNDLEAESKYGALRLAPLNTKTSTPLSTNPSTPQLTQQSSTAALQSTPVNTNNASDQNAFKSSKPVALSSLFGSESKTTKQTSQFYTERQQHSNGSDYIDPKLINKCDNLPIHLSLKRTDYKYTDLDASETRQEQFSSSSSESSAAAKKSTSQQQQQQQYNKLLPLVKQQSEHDHTESNHFYASPVTHHLSHTATNSQRNSAEGRNLLKRRMRVGRNQFLYDASPEADSCSADDEGANRSSLEGDASQRQHNSATRERGKAFERLSSGQFQPVDAPFIPPLPAFDDFDFEEFLSSFENDEEQFPLFKDCREFLMNRTSKKQRSMLMPNSVAPNHQANTLSRSAAPCKKSPSPQTFPPLTAQTLANNEQQQQQQQLHFQFPSLNQPAKKHFNSFSLDNRTGNKFEDLVEAKSTDTLCLEPPQREEYRALDSQSLSQKREIFISIETEQNDLDKASISPNSIRHMVGNPQTVVEVEVDAAHDNKFSKISDDDDAADGLQEPNSKNKNFTEHLPNVQLNNAKNLMQKMQEDFRQLSEDMYTNLRLSKELRTDPVDVNMNANSNLSGTTRNAINMNRTPGCPSGDAYGDSDELSSLDGYPLSSPSSRLGVSSKTSADSAYGSLSRQRSSELSTQRSSSRSRSMATNTANTFINRPLTEESSLTRLRQLSASSSSSSEHALPPITKSGSNNSNSAYHKQHIQHSQQLQHNFSSINNNNLMHNLNDNNNNNSGSGSNYDNQPCLAHLTGANNSQSNLESLQQFTSSSTMSTSMKLSKFCHECGSKFILEHAKFCMDCGVKRVVL